MTMFKSFTLATILLAGITHTSVKAEESAPEGINSRLVVQSGLFSVLDAYSFGKVDIGNKLSFIACGISRDVGNDEIKPNTPVVLDIDCSKAVENGQSIKASIAIVYEPTVWDGTGDDLGGDDTYAADGSIKVWKLAMADTGETIRVTTTVRQQK
ncbi:MAG: hypothetical protein EON60_05525 [Alphaproteobacteria bacterium]|nr:MAG: hypothetical protein EON60_05525 [Alphaproteobacteria bacterium]